MTVRRVETSAHGPGFHVCGVKPEPTEERVALRTDYHPGFGAVTLLLDDEFVWGAVRPEDSRTLGWIERTKVTSQDGTWRVRIDGPMVSYTLVRRSPKYWVLESSELGFA